ncbi:hypothetical protein RFN28_29545 [Mesorhizobium sp. VK24D]|uniref:Uncharacterized protein n=1 Tax=Mesorhizobium album TaxID=3072314 RepID=A0ABU4Y747_9HYPH|nr:hypothetical protein [Mesorhizobium sp. VK24D]MDX8482571.1 hypothetical protein [Mesorhizobium sp. VK24D]
MHWLRKLNGPWQCHRSEIHLGVAFVRLARQLDDVVNIVEMFDRIMRVCIVFFAIRIEFNSEEFATLSNEEITESARKDTGDLESL